LEKKEMSQNQDSYTPVYGYNPYANYAQVPQAAQVDNPYAAAFGYDPYSAAYGFDPYAAPPAYGFDLYAAAPAYSYNIDPTTDPNAVAPVIDPATIVSPDPLTAYSYAAAPANPYASIYGYNPYLAAAYLYYPYAAGYAADPYTAAAGYYDPYAAATYAADPYAAAGYYDPYNAATYAADPYAAASGYYDPYAAAGYAADPYNPYTPAVADPYATAAAPYGYELDASALPEGNAAGSTSYDSMAIPDGTDPYLLPSQSSARIISGSVSKPAPAAAASPESVVMIAASHPFAAAATHSNLVNIATALDSSENADL
jgi:phosphatidylinositol glycan class Z